MSAILPAGDGDEAPTERQGLAGFQLTGKDPEKWAKFRDELFIKFQGLFDQMAEESPESHWLRDQAKEFGALTIDFAKGHLRKPGLEAAKIEAEVADLYASREQKIAAARKIHAESRAVETENKVRDLRITLSMFRAMLIGEKGDEAILIGRQIDYMIEALKAVSMKA